MNKDFRPPVIGILGGVASGKSLVTGQLAALGAKVLDGDKAAHEVLREEAVKAALRRRWGEVVFDGQGDVVRRAVAAIVFSNPAELEFLEQEMHPRIGQRLRQELNELAAAGARAVVLDAAVMLKAGWDENCDCLWYIDAPHDQRLARAISRGWTEEQFAAREASQLPLDEKRRRADAVIDNSGTPQETAEQVRVLWERWTQ